jgi:YedE family putative selenium metabolism protein
MGICGACFLRDTAGSLGLHGNEKVAVLRPEVVGLVLGAFLWVVARGRFQARSGSHAASRFLLGMWMGIGALVFLGCPFRLCQRLGGGDGTALAGAAGLLGGVLAGLAFEKRGYTPGNTAPAPPVVGFLAPALALGLLGMFLAGGLLRGPGPEAPGPPAHAPWGLALGIALAAGAALSATGFCVVSASRQVFAPGKGMLFAAGALIVGYAAVSLATGKFKAGVEDQPAAHRDVLMNILSMALVGLTGVLAGGCPVRQIVMAGEGNGDALLGAAGILAGGALAHNLGLVSSGAGSTVPGRAAVVIGLVFCLVYAAMATKGRAAEPDPA